MVNMRRVDELEKTEILQRGVSRIQELRRGKPVYVRVANSDAGAKRFYEPMDSRSIPTAAHRISAAIMNTAPGLSAGGCIE